MEFLADRFEVFGVTLQFWMPIIVGAAALYILYLWKRGQLNYDDSRAPTRFA